MENCITCRACPDYRVEVFDIRRDGLELAEVLHCCKVHLRKHLVRERGKVVAIDLEDGRCYGRRPLAEGNCFASIDAKKLEIFIFLLGLEVFWILLLDSFL